MCVPVNVPERYDETLGVLEFVPSGNALWNPCTSGTTFRVDTRVKKEQNGY